MNLNILKLLLLSIIVVSACKKSETKPEIKTTNVDPTSDYVKIGNITISDPKRLSIKAGFVGSTRKTELGISIGVLKDSFFSVTHDTIIVNHPCKSGMGNTLKDSTVRFYGRLSFIAGAPILGTEVSNTKYGSYIIKMENGKKVSYFSGIDLIDNTTKKRYICEGRITWP